MERNGIIREFTSGIIEQASFAEGIHVINVRVLHNDQHGIHLRGSNHLVNNCTVSDNGTSASGAVYGIKTGNTAYDNGGSATGSIYYGIYLDGNNLVDQNTAYSNNGTNMDTAKLNCTYGVNHAP